jgi:Ca2+-binding RTX toxin-like protein
MIIRICYRLLTLGLPVLILMGFYAASAATTTVSRSSLDEVTLPVTADDLKPPACAAQHVTNIIVGSGTINGTASNDLILGSPGIDIISGAGGNDCIVGGGGADVLIGNAGNDTCIGGPGIDVLDITCENAQQ